MTRRTSAELELCLDLMSRRAAAIHTERYLVAEQRMDLKVDSDLMIGCADRFKI